TGDPALEAACVRVYNDWIIEFCDAAPERLWGLAMLSIYDMPAAVRELERCRDAGLRGVYVPVGPDPELTYDAPQYEALWEAAAALDMPVSLHINSGLGYGRRNQHRSGLLPDGVH